MCLRRSGIAVTLALEVAAIAWRRGAKFRWREAVFAASTGALMLIALMSPVLVDWLPHPEAHDYADDLRGLSQADRHLSRFGWRLVWLGDPRARSARRGGPPRALAAGPARPVDARGGGDFGGAVPARADARRASRLSDRARGDGLCRRADPAARGSRATRGAVRPGGAGARDLYARGRAARRRAPSRSAGGRMRRARTSTSSRG